jgi:alanine racemase
VDPEYTQLQIERFLRATSGLAVRRHVCNSAGLQFPAGHLDLVRPGLALYGISPGPAPDPLKPILSWKTRILTINDFPSGTPVGYGGSFVTRRRSRIGVLSVGYADGYNRLLSDQGNVKTSAGLAPVVGRVSMDLTTVDLTELPNVTIGQEVTVLDNDPKSTLSARSLAAQTDTIPYEVLTSIGARVDRLYLES